MKLATRYTMRSTQDIIMFLYTSSYFGRNYCYSIDDIPIKKSYNQRYQYYIDYLALHCDD